MDKNNNTEKAVPFSVALNVTRQKIETAINESGLHICVLDMLLQDISHTVNNLANKQTLIELQEFKKDDKKKDISEA